MVTKVATIFNGKYTLKNPATGQHKTFKIHTKKGGNLKGKRILSLLVGPDNMNSYRGFAFVNDDGIKVWSKYRTENSVWQKYANILLDVLTNYENSIYIKKGLQLFQEARCIRCNRTLTHPDSIEMGIGPECINKM